MLLSVRGMFLNYYIHFNQCNYVCVGGYVTVSNTSNHVYINKPFIFIADAVTVLTVATEDNHGLQRFLRSAKVYDIDVQILGKGDEWKGGDMSYAGGGHKVNLLKQRLTEMMKSENKEKIVLFVDR